MPAFASKPTEAVHTTHKQLPALGTNYELHQNASEPYHKTVQRYTASYLETKQPVPLLNLYTPSSHNQNSQSEPRQPPALVT